MNIKYPCIVCDKNVKCNQNAMLCSMCLRWCHLKCTPCSRDIFVTDKDWICRQCLLLELPFYVREEDDSDNQDHNSKQISHTEDSHEQLCEEKKNIALHIEKHLQKLNDADGLKVAHLNCASLTKNIDELRILMSQSNIHVLTLSETHLNELIADSEIACNNYSVLRKDRNRAGGGVAAYIRNDVDYKLRVDLMDDDLEILIIEVKRKNVKPFLIVTWYRPPNANLKTFQLFESVLQRIDDLSHECIILGDMNCDTMPEDKPWQTKHLFDVTEGFGYAQLVQSVTRITATSSSILDLIMTNTTEKIGTVEVLPITLSDHFLVYCTWGKKRVFKSGEHKYKVARNLKKVDYNKLKEDISAQSWESVIEDTNVETAYAKFENVIHKVIDKHAPLRKKRIKKKESPWINDQIINLIRGRDIQKSFAKKSCLPDDWQKYRSIRNKVTSEIRRAKREYITSSIINCNGKSGDVWKSLKFVLPNKCETERIMQVEIENKEINDKEEIAECFNTHFTNVGKTIQENIESNTQVQNDDCLQNTDNQNNLHFKSVDETDVLNHLNNLATDKACGLDNLPAVFLKSIAEHISKPLTHIYNLSILQNKVPSTWKQSRITPIYKGTGERSNMNNYRPISILPILAKIMEKLIFDQLYAYLQSKGLLNKHQSGFRPNHSTMTALLNVTEYWLNKLDKGMFVGVIALDLQKAFDTVDHAILLHKMRLYGLSDSVVEWFRSYLADRTQCTVVNGVQSRPQTISCGIPQGSNLGPLLFILYINDLPLCVKNSEVSLYADDTCLYYSCKDVNRLVGVLNEDLDRIHGWLVRNKLALNARKCEFLLLGSRRKLNAVSPPSVKIKDNIINRVTHCKYLGVQIDQHLDWVKHVECMQKKLHKCLYLLKRIRPFINKQMAMTFYKTIIQSKIDYCSVIWGNVAKTHADKLQKIQNRALRIIMRVNWRFPSETLFQIIQTEFHDTIDQLFERCNKQMLCVMYKIVNGNLPPNIVNLFSYRQYLYGLRKTTLQLEIPKPTTNFKKRSLAYRGPKIWNSLPNNVKQCASLAAFKAAIDKSYPNLKFQSVK